MGVVCEFVHACKHVHVVRSKNSISELIEDSKFKLQNTVLTWHSIPH